jgi:DNA-directed RNA polymerase I subunit RPA49
MLVDDVTLAQTNCEFSLSHNKQSRKCSQMRIHADSDRITYEGHNYGKHSLSTLPYRYVVALLDDDKQQATLFEPELFLCNRVIKNQQAEAAGKDGEDDITSTSPPTTVEQSEYSRSRMLLGESFGTKKTKQMLSSLDRNKININQLASQSSFIGRRLDCSIDRISTETNGKDKQLSSDNDGDSLSISDEALLPPHDAKTKNITEIYKMENLIPQEVYYSLNVGAFVDALKSKNSTTLASAMEAYDLEESVSGRIKALGSLSKMPAEASIEHTVRCLLYLHYLLRFRALNESKINSGKLSSILPLASEELIASLRKQYTEAIAGSHGKERYKVSNVSKDKLIIHIAIMTLLLDGFRVNVARLAASLKLPAVKMGEYMKSVGCVLEKPVDGESGKYVAPGSTREVQVKMAVLKAPLTISSLKPKNNRPRGKK